jgi:transcriptional regulator with XRE-family HTH domain
MEITPEQIRAARALIRVEQSDLADRAHVSVVTIRRLEAPDGSERVAPATIASVQHALEQAGVEFIPGGVRRRRATPRDHQALYQELREISLRSAAYQRQIEQLTEGELYDGNGLPA